MKHIKTQKIYTFPDRKLYGEYCSTSLLELRIKIIKGEIKEQLCFLGENGRAYCFDRFGNPDSYPDFYLAQIESKLLHEIIKEQMKIKKNERALND